jgi:outer membrane lipoprotein-sorting protein
MKVRFLLPALAALALAAPLQAQELRPRLPPPDAPVAAPVVAVLSGADRTAALTQANATLNGVTRLQGRFLQQSPDGSRSTGMFYLQRPGKLRFQYDPPATLLIVSDGNVVSMRDRALRTTDRTPLRATPLNLILRSQVNLEHDARITRVARQGQWLQITARDRSGQSDGQITLYFVGPGAQLASWDVIDATGARTRITLSGLTQPASFDSALFRLEDVVQSRAGPRH